MFFMKKTPVPEKAAKAATVLVFLKKAATVLGAPSF
jgi:hypothetical protein